MDTYQIPPMFGSDDTPDPSRPLGGATAPKRETAAPRERYIAPEAEPQPAPPAMPAKAAAAGAPLVSASGVPLPPRKPPLPGGQRSPDAVRASGGPSMPALPATPVQAETLFEPPADAEKKTETAKDLPASESPPPPSEPGRDITEPTAGEAEATTVPEAAGSGQHPSGPVQTDQAPGDPGEAVAVLSFAPGDPEIGAAHIKLLERSPIVRTLRAEGGRSLRILAYASAIDNSQSGPRRISLSRALSVRAWLLKQGVTPERIEVRALGERTGGKDPADSVELHLMEK